MEPVAVHCNHQFSPQTIIDNWWLHDLWMVYNPVIKILLYLFINFGIPFSILFQCPWFISKFNYLELRFSRSNSTVISFFVTSKMLVNRHGDFRGLGFLIGVDVMGDIWLLLVNPSGVEIIAASIISFNCCWSSKLPACLYNFLMFSRHLCSYIALLLKDGSIPMVCTWYFSRVYCNITLSTSHCCSNVSIERTRSITLVIILDLIHLAAWSDLPSFRKHIYSLLTGGNIVGVFKFNILEDVEAIRCEWWLGVEMVGML